MSDSFWITCQVAAAAVAIFLFVPVLVFQCVKMGRFGWLAAADYYEKRKKEGSING